MSLKHQLTSQVAETLKQLDLEDIFPQIDYPSDPKNGDYATNVAFVAAKRLGKHPMEFAEEIVTKLKGQKSHRKTIAHLEVAKPGFINFRISDELLVETVGKLVNEKNADNRGKSLLNKKIMVEFTDPNPFKEFHIGHLYSNIVGESLCRIFEYCGATVWRVDYFGDVGMHVAKAVWGLQRKIKDQKSHLKDLEKKSLDERVKLMGEAYASGATAFEEDAKAAEDIKHLNLLVYLAAQRMWQEEKGVTPSVDYRKDKAINEQELEDVYQLYTTGRQWSLAYFETIYERLGTKFAAYYPESLASEKGYQLVRQFLAKGVFVQSQGAVVFPGEQFDLHTRVFINALGLPTYEAKELGLAPWKYKEFPYDTSIILTGNEINEYFKVLIAAMKQVEPELGEKTKHIGHGMVRLPEGKMSSRTGKIKTGESLLDQAAEEALKLLEQKDDKKLAEVIGQAAVKYAFLKQSIGKDVTFNFSESITFEGNSGPYLQYTFARTQSVLRKAGISHITYHISNIKFEPEERDIMRLLIRFTDIVEEAAARYSPNLLASYLFDLAQAYNLFYQKCPILKAEEEKMHLRLLLTQASGEIIKNGLYLLGIEAPERM